VKIGKSGLKRKAKSGEEIISDLKKRLEQNGIRIRVENGAKIEERYGENLAKVFEALKDALLDLASKTSISKFSVIDNLGEQKDIWQKKKEPGRIIINLAKITPGTPEFEEKKNRLVRKIMGIEEVPAKAPSKMKPAPEKVKLIELGSGIKIRLPDIDGLRIERKIIEKDFCSLLLSRAEESLAIWLDTKEEIPAIQIGDISYEIVGGNLFELKPIPLLGLFGFSRPIKRSQLTKDDAGIVVIDLRKVEENDEVNNLLGR
jgi:hypothetical protein